MNQNNRPIFASSFYSFNATNFINPYQTIVKQANTEKTQRIQYNNQVYNQISQEVNLMSNQQTIPPKGTKQYFEYLSKRLQKMNTLIDSYK